MVQGLLVRVQSILVFLSLLLGYGSVFANPLSPLKPRLLEAETYAENWHVMVDAGDKGYYAIHFIISNVGRNISHLPAFTPWQAPPETINCKRLRGHPGGSSGSRSYVPGKPRKSLGWLPKSSQMRPRGLQNSSREPSGRALGGHPAAKFRGVFRTPG